MATDMAEVSMNGEWDGNVMKWENEESRNRLAAVQRVKMTQGNAILEGLTGGVMPNTYFFTDYNRMVTDTKGKEQPSPLFFADEEAGDCCSGDCWCRTCCSPNHPSLIKFYVAGDYQRNDDCVCCGTTIFERDDTSQKTGEAFMTLERYGLCHRFAHCWVCCTCCRDEMRLHHGNVGNVMIDGQKAGELPDTTVISRGVVPIGGGGCTPTVELYSRVAPGALAEEAGGDDAGATQTNEKRMGVVEGPMCFGGCKDFFCDTEFYINKNQGVGEEGSYATITKVKPSDCSGWCTACCSSADTYNLVVQEEARKDLAPDQMAMILGEMDYLFFEGDKFPCEVKQTGDTTWITILCCLCYCYGCLCPITCSIPCSNKDGGGD